MITLPFEKIDLVFMLLPRRLLLVRMIAGVVVMRYQGRSLLLSFYFFLLREFWNRDGWMFLRAVDVLFYVLSVRDLLGRGGWMSHIYRMGEPGLHAAAAWFLPSIIFLDVQVCTKKRK